MTEQTDSIDRYASANRLAVAAAVLLGLFAFVSLPLVGLFVSNIPLMRLAQVQSILVSTEAAAAEEPVSEVTVIWFEGVRAAAALAEQFLRPVMAIGLVAAVVCLIWIYRVHANLPVLGARNLKFTPLWAVGWWFIPIAHLFRPYQVLREIWHGSDPVLDVVVRGHGGETTLRMEASTVVLGWWWALVVSALALQFYYPFLAAVTGDDTGEISSLFYVALFSVKATSTALNIAAAVLAILVVLKIDRMQTEKQRLLAARQSPPLDPA